MDKMDVSLNGAEPSFKHMMVCNWVRRRLGSVAHELRVARIAEKLFSLTRKWHDLGAMELKLLALAALVHDVGRAQGKKGHAKIGARMVMESATLPLGAGERRRLAYLTRHHRGRVPEPGAESYLDRDSDDGRAMRILLGLLRAADSLDSRVRGGHQFVATIRGRTLTFCAYVSGDAAAEAKILAKPKKFALLESTLHCEVRTEWYSTDRLALVS